MMCQGVRWGWGRGEVKPTPPALVGGWRGWVGTPPSHTWPHHGWRGWVEPPPLTLGPPSWGCTGGGRLFIYLYLILYILDGAGGGLFVLCWAEIWGAGAKVEGGV